MNSSGAPAAAFLGNTLQMAANCQSKKPQQKATATDKSNGNQSNTVQVADSNDKKKETTNKQPNKCRLS